MTARKLPRTKPRRKVSIASQASREVPVTAFQGPVVPTARYVADVVLLHASACLLKIGKIPSFRVVIRGRKVTVETSTAKA